MRKNALLAGLCLLGLVACSGEDSSNKTDENATYRADAGQAKVLADAGNMQAMPADAQPAATAPTDAASQNIAPPSPPEAQPDAAAPPAPQGDMQNANANPPQGEMQQLQPPPAQQDAQPTTPAPDQNAGSNGGTTATGAVTTPPPGTPVAPGDAAVAPPVEPTPAGN